MFIHFYRNVNEFILCSPFFVLRSSFSVLPFLARRLLLLVTMATIKRPEDLDAYRLAVELRERVFAIIARPAVARQFKFCDQIRDSGRSAPANLSEGLGRYKPRDNARFVRFALGSLNETQNHLGEAHTQKYIDETEYHELFDLAGRAIAASTGWHNYLVSCPVKPTRHSTQNPKSGPKNEEPGPKNEPGRRHEERRTKNQERRTENQERRTENQERRTENQERRTENQERRR